MVSWWFFSSFPFVSSVEFCREAKVRVGYSTSQYWLWKPSGQYWVYFISSCHFFFSFSHTYFLFSIGLNCYSEKKARPEWQCFSSSDTGSWLFLGRMSTSVISFALGSMVAPAQIRLQSFILRSHINIFFFPSRSSMCF